MAEEREPRVSDALEAWREAERKAIRVTAMHEAVEAATRAAELAEQAASETAEAVRSAARTAEATADAATKATTAAREEEKQLAELERLAVAEVDSARQLHREARDLADARYRDGESGEETP